MLRKLIELCSSDQVLFWAALGSDLTIAFAYFAIPVTMAVVFRDRKADIPYPWLWILFVTFILACGVTHMVHVWSALSGYEWMSLHAAIGIFTALASVGTAIAFAFVTPEIKALPSPREQHAHLEKLVSERTQQKDDLISEINHRVRNQLQIMSSLLHLEMHRAQTGETKEALDRLSSELDQLHARYAERLRKY
jgi:Signal transduction histidine kinase